MIQLIKDSREPIFATAMDHKGGLKIYYDKDGQQACCNFVAHPSYRPCSICHNACINFKVNEDDSYTCSACGKFPRELLQQ